MNKVYHKFKPELLMPAGDLEKAKIAYQFGADACYGSTSAFSMRTREIGFNYRTLKEAIDYAHSIGKKFYVTLNTYPHEFELPKIKAHAKKLISMNPDAIIVADPGILAIVKKLISKYSSRETRSSNAKNSRIHSNTIEIHLSTQTNVTNSESMKFWANQGISRIILPRELSLKEIAKIRAAVPKKVLIEAFVHGAMCNSVSGRCNLSNYLSYRDANRGVCVQACRWKYSLVEEKRPGQFIPIEEDDNGSYIYNSKDLCMIEHLKEMADAGIQSFKIEGRNKSIYYAAIVARAYRQAIDILNPVIARRNDEVTEGNPTLEGDPKGNPTLEGDRRKPYFRGQSLYKEIATPSHKGEWLAMTKQETQKILKELSTVTNRGYSTGFYFGKPTDADINYESSRPTSDWQFVGIVKESLPGSLFSHPDQSECGAEGSLNNKKISPPVRANELEVSQSRNDNLYLIEARNEIKPGTKVEIVTPKNIYKMKLDKFFSPDGTPVEKPNPNTLFVLHNTNNLPINSIIRARS